MHRFVLLHEYSYLPDSHRQIIVHINIYLHYQNTIHSQSLKTLIYFPNNNNDVFLSINLHYHMTMLFVH